MRNPLGWVETVGVGTDKGGRMAKGDIHTVWRDGRWYNEAEGNSRASNSATTKTVAQAAGRRLAKIRKVEHLIHKKDGTIGERNSYGNDPASRPG
jgi:hypothetical protein